MSAEEIAEIEQSAKDCVDNIEGLAVELLNDVTKILELLLEIRKELDNPVRLAILVAKLERAINKLQVRNLININL